MPAPTPFRYERPVRFEEVDAAGIVFFARYLNLCHEAMEAFFSRLDGGYVGLIVHRKIGFPAVRIETTYRAPLRYGDVILIDVVASRVGRTSATFRYEFRNKATNQVVSEVDHTVVCCNLDTLTPEPWPDDTRRLMSPPVDGLS